MSSKPLVSLLRSNLLETLVGPQFRIHSLTPVYSYRMLGALSLLFHFILAKCISVSTLTAMEMEEGCASQSPVVKRMVGAGLTVQSVVVPGLGWGTCFQKVTISPAMGHTILHGRPVAHS